MSDGSGSGEGRQGKKKKSLVSRIRKIPNPFKKSHSDSDDEGETTVSPVSGKPSQGTSSNASSSPLGRDQHSAVMERQDGGRVNFAQAKEAEQDPARAIKQADPTARLELASPDVRAVPTKPVAKPVAKPEQASASTRKQAPPSTPAGTSASSTRESMAKEDVGPVFGVAEIVLTGVKGVPQEVLKAVRERGFAVHLATIQDDTEPAALTLVLAIGPKLMKKCAIERKLPAKAREKYTPGELAELCAHAIKVIRRSGLQFQEVNLLHDKKALAEVMKASRKSAADDVNAYFGPYFGLYFAWLKFYTSALALPTLAGIWLWISQWRRGTPDGPLLPISCLALMVWATVFLELWRRRNREIAFRWGVDGVEDDENMRVVAEKAGEFKPNPAGKFCVTVPIICAAIYAVIRIMLYCIWLSDNAVEVYGEESYMRHLALVLYSVVPLVAGSLYRSLAKALNDYEEHRTPVIRKNMLVVKMFAFQFVNSYCALFYVAFWLRDLERLRALLMTMVIVKQFVAQLQEKYQPRLFDWWKSRQAKSAKEPQYVVKHTGTVTLDEVNQELRAGPGTVEDDYLEMVLQFGYVSMFGVVFPLAPFFAFVNNIWEFRLDLNILGRTRRPQAHAESRIGAWELCLEVICVVSCLTNLLLALVVSENADVYVPTSLSDRLGTIEGKVVLAVVVEHLLLLLKALIGGLVDGTPSVVREAQAVVAINQQEKRKEIHRAASGLSASSRGQPGAGVESSPTVRLQQLHGTFGVPAMGPMWYLPLVLLPFLTAWLGWSAFWVLPVAFVFVSYLQHRKDKATAALALGVVKDPKVLKLVTDFLPAWYKDSDVERVEWLNNVINKLWVSVSAATRDICYTTVQPILDSYRPVGVSALGFRKVSLGTIPPKVVGVRALRMTGDKAVMDLDLRWAANAEFVLEAGVKPVPLLITLDKIRFSGRMRVELAPFVPVFPCFGAIAVTFMEKPFLDFSFSLGKLDVMSIGPGEASIGTAVSNIIKNIVDTMMVFPKKMVIPILPEQDLLDLAHPIPKGIVTVTLVGADNLRSADITGKSDPYVKVTLGQDQKVKTDVKSNTTSPRWNDTFDLLVYEPSVEVINFRVLDKDKTGDDDSLGQCELPVSVLKDDVEIAHNIALSGTKTGSLLIKAMFVPLSSGPERQEQDDEDVIVNMAGDVITDETVASEDYANLTGSTGPAKPAKGKTSDDPSKLSPTAITTDDSMGVLTVMGIECKGVKKGDRYVSVIVGNTKRKTPIEKGKTSFAYSDVFHFLVNGAKSAVMEVLLKEDERIGHDKVMGSFKVYVAEVIANEDQLDGEWDLTGDNAQGSIKMRIKWSGRVGQARGT